ncbi:MAG TPA: DUF5103 domain-containing protein [Cytophagaceae bacterium]|jgi:hypothetical protein|nr:DUF5103 domain-containing protein [Cytophagaceae bacterium]
MKKQVLPILVCFLGIAFHKLHAEVPAIDAIYKSTIKTVQFYSTTRDTAIVPIIYLSNQDLSLEFDELRDEADSYYFKIVHCNADWQPSNLRSIQYMKDFNEIFIQSRQFSAATKIGFTHYAAPLPIMLVSGNFFIKVYEEGNEDKVLLTRRFLVIENNLDIVGQVGFPNNTTKVKTHQMVSFNILYPSYNVVNPATQLNVIIRQNYDWRTATPKLLPMYIREDLRQLEYTYYNDATTFPGGNEYRYFDMRSFYFNGFNVGRIIKRPDSTDILLAIDKTRASNTYILWEDLDGRMYVQNYETGGTRIEPDYGKVHFSLETKEMPGANVYVYGALSNWDLAPENKMKYNSETEAYEVSFLLKQGIYNYRYFVTGKGMEENYYEGNYNATENVYDIIVYYRVPGEFYDRIIGYQTMSSVGNTNFNR